MKVFGWIGFRTVPGLERMNPQTRELMAAPSKAAVARALGGARQSDFMNLGETHNAMEINVAMQSVGEVFWIPLHLSGLDSTKVADYRRGEKK